MYTDFRIAMGIRMRNRRKELNLTQEEMAEHLNISVKHYGGFERGEAGMSLEILVAASDFLNLSLDYLIKGKDIENEDYIPKRIQEIYERSSSKKKIHILNILEEIDEI